MSEQNDYLNEAQDVISEIHEVLGQICSTIQRNERFEISNASKSADLNNNNKPNNSTTDGMKETPKQMETTQGNENFETPDSSDYNTINNPNNNATDGMKETPKHVETLQRNESYSTTETPKQMETFQGNESYKTVATNSTDLNNSNSSTMNEIKTKSTQGGTKQEVERRQISGIYKTSDATITSDFKSDNNPTGGMKTKETAKQVRVIQTNESFDATDFNNNNNSNNSYTNEKETNPTDIRDPKRIPKMSLKGLRRLKDIVWTSLNTDKDKISDATDITDDVNNNKVTISNGKAENMMETEEAMQLETKEKFDQEKSDTTVFNNILLKQYFKQYIKTKDIEETKELKTKEQYTQTTFHEEELEKIFKPILQRQTFQLINKKVKPLHNQVNMLLQENAKLNAIRSKLEEKVQTLEQMDFKKQIVKKEPIDDYDIPNRSTPDKENQNLNKLPRQDLPPPPQRQTIESTSSPSSSPIPMMSLRYSPLQQHNSLYAPTKPWPFYPHSMPLSPSDPFFPFRYNNNNSHHHTNNNNNNNNNNNSQNHYNVPTKDLLVSNSNVLSPFQGNPVSTRRSFNVDSTSDDVETTLKRRHLLTGNQSSDNNNKTGERISLSVKRLIDEDFRNEVTKYRKVCQTDFRGLPSTNGIQLVNLPRIYASIVRVSDNKVCLSWDFHHSRHRDFVNPTVSYHLFAYQIRVYGEMPPLDLSLWKKIGVVEAMPLPMSCTLSQFAYDKVYFFAILPADVSGRFGKNSNFCAFRF